MCEGGAQQGVQTSYKIIVEIVEQNERNPARKAKVITEIEKFLGPGGSGINGFPTSGLEVKQRENF